MLTVKCIIYNQVYTVSRKLMLVNDELLSYREQRSCMFDALSESVYTVWIWCLWYTNTHQSSNCNDRSKQSINGIENNFFLAMEYRCLSGSFRNELLFNVSSIIILKGVKQKICKQWNILQRVHLVLPVL